MNKHFPILREIKNTIQDKIPNIELISLLISIILGGAGAILFFLKSLNKLDLLSISRIELIGMTIFLWAILAFFIYPIILSRSNIIVFLRQKCLWQFVGWFILISLPFLLIEVQRTSLNHNGLLISLIIFLIFILLWGLLGLMLADVTPLPLVMKRLKRIMVISFILYVILYVVGLSIIANENSWSFRTVILDVTIWKLFLTFFAQVYWVLCIFMIFIWSIIDKSIYTLTVMKALSLKAKSKLKQIEQFLVDTLRINSLFVPIIKILVFYFVGVSLVIILFDYSILYEFEIWGQLSLLYTFHQFVAIVLLTVGTILFSGLIIVTIMYLTFPQELKRIRLKNNIHRMTLILFLLFILWWFSWALAALNLEIFNQNAFVFADGRTGMPKQLDFVFYIFALMTSAGYGELKPLSFGAHIFVMLVTATGLALLIIFVGAALSFDSKSSKFRRRRKM